MRVLGADVAAGAWVGVVLSPSGVDALGAPTMAELAGRAAAEGPLDAVGVDIPIGLLDVGRRRADLAAQAALGSRRSTIFPTPVRAALLAADYPAAAAANRRATGSGLSRQSYALKDKILEVDDWVRWCGLDVVEAHPELSFVELARRAGTPVPLARKKSWAGAVQRARLLRGAGIDLLGVGDGLLGTAGSAGVDDVLDAAAVAWTARRRAQGSARPLPDPPEVLRDGRAAAIWT